MSHLEVSLVCYSPRLLFAFNRRQIVIALICVLLSICGPLPAQASETHQKNFTSITPEDMNQIANLHERAEGLIAQHKFRDAINVYSEIVLTEPDDEDAYADMGQAYMVLGDFKRAKDAFQNALHINPENEIASLGLGKIVDPDFAATAPAAKPEPPAITVETTEPAKAPPAAPVIAFEAPKPFPPTAAIAPSVKKPAPNPAPVSSDISAMINSTLSFNQFAQTALQNAGLYHGPVDGVMNENTQKAVRIFQKNNKIEINGMVGPETWSKLKHYLDNRR